MKNIRNAFAEFWGGFYNRSSLLPEPVPLKAFPSGFAAEENAKGTKPPPLPYITYDIARPAFGDFTILAGRIWTRGTSWELVDDVLAQAAFKIPESGTKLDLGEDGRIMLYRSNPFCGYLPPEDNDMLNKAGVIRLIVKNYVY